MRLARFWNRDDGTPPSRTRDLRLRIALWRSASAWLWSFASARVCFAGSDCLVGDTVRDTLALRVAGRPLLPGRRRAMALRGAPPPASSDGDAIDLEFWFAHSPAGERRQYRGGAGSSTGLTSARCKHGDQRLRGGSGDGERRKLVLCRPERPGLSAVEAVGPAPLHRAPSCSVGRTGSKRASTAMKPSASPRNRRSSPLLASPKPLQTGHEGYSSVGLSRVFH